MTEVHSLIARQVAESVSSSQILQRHALLLLRGGAASSALVAAASSTLNDDAEHDTITSPQLSQVITSTSGGAQEGLIGSPEGKAVVLLAVSMALHYLGKTGLAMTLTRCQSTRSSVVYEFY